MTALEGPITLSRDYYSNGVTRQQIGNIDYYSNGKTCRHIGTITYRS